MGNPGASTYLILPKKWTWQEPSKALSEFRHHVQDHAMPDSADNPKLLWCPPSDLLAPWLLGLRIKITASKIAG